MCKPDHYINLFNSRKKLQRIISQGSMVDLFSASQLYLCNYVYIVSVREEWNHLLRCQVLWYPPSFNSLFIARKRSFTCSSVEKNFCANLHLNSTWNGWSVMQLWWLEKHDVLSYILSINFKTLDLYRLKGIGYQQRALNTVVHFNSKRWYTFICWISPAVDFKWYYWTKKNFLLE